MKHKHLARVVSLVAMSLLVGCSDGTAPSDEPPGPDLSTPAGTLRALQDFYSLRQADETLALLDAGYRFHPTDPSVFPFLGPGDTFWEFDREKLILDQLLVPERATWIDQVLLEISKRDERELPDGTVEYDARVQLTVLIGLDLIRGESEVTYVLRADGEGNYRIVEEREFPATVSPAPPTIGFLRWESAEDRGGR